MRGLSRGLDALADCHGVGESKLKKFGDIVLKIVALEDEAA